jgi:hypothetical protein
MDQLDYCERDGLSYWTVEEIQKYPQLEEFVLLHPNEGAYYFLEHHKFYTVAEMERLVRLKAFL